MKSILIPVDFSEGSFHSCRYALQLFGDQKVTLHLFHIYNDQIMLPDAGMPEAMDNEMFYNTDLIMALKQQAEQQMEDLKKQVVSFIETSGKQVTVQTLLQGGDPRWEITETCKELNPDLVVMGTRGTGKKGFLEGSMAARIMEKAPVPVLAVPEDYASFRLKNIMYPTAFNGLDIHTLQQIFSLLEPLRFKIHVCHFHLAKKEKKTDILMEELEKAFEKEKTQGKIAFYLEEAEDKETALKNFARQHNIDLLAFFPEKKKPFEYLFSSHHLHKKDFFKLELPLMAVPE